MGKVGLIAVEQTKDKEGKFQNKRINNNGGVLVNAASYSALPAAGSW
jgi:hypothetical protein